MEYRNDRMGLLRDMVEECINSVDFMFKVRKDGNVYCVAPSDANCPHRQLSEDGAVHRYRCHYKLKVSS